MSGANSIINPEDYLHDLVFWEKKERRPKIADRKVAEFRWFNIPLSSFLSQLLPVEKPKLQQTNLILKKKKCFFNPPNKPRTTKLTFGITLGPRSKRQTKLGQRDRN